MDNIIEEVTKEESKVIICDYKPLGLFYMLDNKIYIGIDNSSGDAYVEEFIYKEDCLRWLNGEELDSILISDDDTNEMKIEKLKKFYESRKMTHMEMHIYLYLTNQLMVKDMCGQINPQDEEDTRRYNKEKIDEELGKQNDSIDINKLSSRFSDYLKETNKERMLEGWPELKICTVVIEEK